MPLRPTASKYKGRGVMLFDNSQSKFESLVRAYSTELYRYAHWLCRDHFQAEDLVQETFTRAWQGLDGLRDAKAVKGWLYTILRREHARLYAHKRLEIDEHQELDDIEGSGGSSAYDGLEMRDALRTLPEGYREPLLLQVLGGFSCEEIASMMDISTGAVMTRLSRARLAARKLSGKRTGYKVRSK